MARPRKPKAFEQGCLRDLYRIWIVPLLKQKPKQIEISEYLDYIFCIHSRHIDRYRAKRDFEMPGLFLAAPNSPVAGLKRPLICTGQELWVRVDREMQRADVEFWLGDTIETTVFRLTEKELEGLRPLLKDFPFPHRDDKPHSWEPKNLWRFDDPEKKE